MNEWQGRRPGTDAIEATSGAAFRGLLLAKSLQAATMDRMSSPASIAATYVLKVYDQRSLLTTIEFSRPTILGRQRQGEGPPFTCIPTGEVQRLVIAPSQEVTISREHLKIAPHGDGQVELTNINDKNIVGLAEGQMLQPGQTRVVPLPAVCVVGHRVIRVEAAATHEHNLQSLARPAMAPGQNSSIFSTANLQPLSAGRQGGRITDSELLAWLQASMEVFQCAAASAEFLPKSTEAALRMVGLDATAVVLREAGDWKIASVAHRPDRVNPDTWRPSRTMLDRVLTEPRTFFNIPRMVGIDHTALLLRDGDDWKVASANSTGATASDPRQTMLNRVVAEPRTLTGTPRTSQFDSGQIGMQSLVATPILDSAGQVLGVLYGERRAYEREKLKEPITELEAKLFELLAYGVASGLARMDQERKLIAERVRFEQFFTPELARLMQEQGESMMAPRDAEITVLFCDIKAFSRISAGMGAAIAMEWLGDVLSMLSDCVAEFDGVLVDYSGDALEAIWGAPLTIDDHAAQACRAALRMRCGLPEINQRWQARLGETTEVSIGINSGLAQVGNIGSKRKFKYGALGTTVNLASRVQGATKHLGVPLLVTQPTASRLSENFQVRRLCQVRTINIDEPVELYELSNGLHPRWHELKKRYEEALGLFEQNKFYDAMAQLGALVAEFPQDEPTRRLLQRNVVCLSQPPEKFDRVWTLDSK